MDHLNLVFPQWQGGGEDLSVYEGAEEIKALYLNHEQYISVPVHTEKGCIFTQPEDIKNKGKMESSIPGYDFIQEQILNALEIIKQQNPRTVFTIGGGCDADIPAVSYLNQKYEGDLAVLWFDAHGDLNTPEASPSRLFYGMPLQVLLGGTELTLQSAVARNLSPDQVILLGGRVLDDWETLFMHQQGIPLISVETLEKRDNTVLEAVKKTGRTHLYIHIDLDVLDPAAFPHVPVPAVGGLTCSTLRHVLHQLIETLPTVGIGLFEYKPVGTPHPTLAALLEMGLQLKAGRNL